ncbi:hypothetical protein WJX72_002522 [[Myrmecia] bisecta]|uniref:Group 1 truncated hemoglobin n=1 Tax=[Myrmecia] bisecta TaxID=41462 RepID=A0AAW1QPL7_9CHLO
MMNQPEARDCKCPGAEENEPETGKRSVSWDAAALAQEAARLSLEGITAFYQRTVADKRVKHFYEGVDIHRLRAKQVQFMELAFGGPEAYRGRDIYAAHARLRREQGLDEFHFDVILEHFASSLQSLSIPQELISEAMSVLRPLRQTFVRHSSEDQDSRLASVVTLEHPPRALTAEVST